MTLEKHCKSALLLLSGLPEYEPSAGPTGIMLRDPLAGEMVSESELGQGIFETLTTGMQVAPRASGGGGSNGSGSGDITAAAAAGGYNYPRPAVAAAALEATPAQLRAAARKQRKEEAATSRRLQKLEEDSDGASHLYGYQGLDLIEDLVAQADHAVEIHRAAFGRVMDDMDAIEAEAAQALLQASYDDADGNSDSGEQESWDSSSSSTSETNHQHQHQQQGGGNNNPQQQQQSRAKIDLGRFRKERLRRRLLERRKQSHLSSLIELAIEQQQQELEQELEEGAKIKKVTNKKRKKDEALGESTPHYHQQQQQQQQQQPGGNYNPQYPHPGGNSNPHQQQQPSGSMSRFSGWRTLKLTEEQAGILSTIRDNGMMTHHHRHHHRFPLPPSQPGPGPEQEPKQEDSDDDDDDDDDDEYRPAALSPVQRNAASLLAQTCSTLRLEKTKALAVVASSPWILAYRSERSTRVLAALAVTLGMSAGEISKCVSVYPRLLSLSVEGKLSEVLRALTTTAAAMYERSTEASLQALAQERAAELLEQNLNLNRATGKTTAAAIISSPSSSRGPRKLLAAQSLGASALGDVDLARDVAELVHSNRATWESDREADRAEKEREWRLQPEWARNSPSSDSEGWADVDLEAPLPTQEDEMQRAREEQHEIIQDSMARTYRELSEEEGVHPQAAVAAAIGEIHARRRNTVRAMVRSLVLRYPLILGTSLDRINERLVELEEVGWGRNQAPLNAVDWPDVVNLIRRAPPAHKRWLAKGEAAAEATEQR
jgi:hypothetical protein